MPRDICEEAKDRDDDNDVKSEKKNKPKRLRWSTSLRMLRVIISTYSRFAQSMEMGLVWWPNSDISDRTTTTTVVERIKTKRQRLFEKNKQKKLDQKTNNPKFVFLLFLFLG